MSEYVSRLGARVREVVKLFESTGNVEQVRAVVDAIDDVDDRDHVAARVAQFLAALGNEEALDVARTVVDLPSRADCWLEVGRAYARRCEFGQSCVALEEAIASAERIQESPWNAASLMLEACVEFDAIGSHGRARDVLRRAVELARRGDDWESMKALGGCAVLLARWSDRLEATEVASGMLDPDWRQFTLGRIYTHASRRELDLLLAEALSEIRTSLSEGRIDHATALAESIRAVPLLVGGVGWDLVRAALTDFQRCYPRQDGDVDFLERLERARAATAPPPLGVPDAG